MNSLNRDHSAFDTALGFMSDLLTDRFVQGTRLVQREKTSQVMDQYQAVVEFDDALDLFEAGHDLRRTDDLGWRTFDYLQHFIHYQNHRAPLAPRNDKLVGRRNLPLRQTEPAPNIEHRQDAALQIDHPVHNGWRLRQRGHFRGSDDALDHGQRQRVPLLVQAENDQLSQIGEKHTTVNDS